MTKPDFVARFWGARGTLASNSKSCEKYGGNTACLEIKCGEERLIFDAGSGLMMFGDDLMRQREKNRSKKRLHMFITHCHYDHISGFPFFAPLYDKKTKIDIWSGHLQGKNKTERMIKDYMSPPFFPVGPEVFSAKIRYRDFEPRDVLKPVRGVSVQTLSLDHHNGCIGYRVNFDGRSICYITDTTHNPAKLDEGILEIIQDTDLFIYDGTYTDAEFPQFWDFGHSTWQEGVRLAKAANAKRYCVFHHRPSRTDKMLDKISEQCRSQFPKSWIGREGLKIKV